MPDSERGIPYHYINGEEVGPAEEMLAFAGTFQKFFVRPGESVAQALERALSEDGRRHEIRYKEA